MNSFIVGRIDIGIFAPLAGRNGLDRSLASIINKESLEAVVNDLGPFWM